MLDSEPLSRWLINPLRIALCNVTPRWLFRVPVRCCAAHLLEVVHHLVVILLLGFGRPLFVLIVDVAEGVGSLQRLGGGVEGGFDV